MTTSGTPHAYRNKHSVAYNEMGNEMGNDKEFSRIYAMTVTMANEACCSASYVSKK